MTEHDQIRILLVDDHKVLREGLRSLLQEEKDMVIVGEAGTEQEAIRSATTLIPDVIIMDLGLPGGSGLDAIQTIKQTLPEIRIVVLSMHSRREVVLKALQAGCDGYVPKSSAHNSLLEAIRTVHEGERFLHPKAASALIEELTDARLDADLLLILSDRERDVLKLTAMGYTSREIGDQLALSPKTVDTYRQRVMEKLNLSHRAALVQFALRAGLLRE